MASQHRAYEVLEGLHLHPIEDLTERSKFITGIVGNEDQLYFIKLLKDEGSAAWEDLENEAAWNTYTRAALSRAGFRIPSAIDNAPDYSWVLFEHLKGTPPREQSLPNLLSSIALLGVSIIQVPLS